LAGPFAGAFLLSFDQNQEDDGGTGLRIGLGENIGGDFNQVGFQFAAVPFS
jgi:hypothetical protein